MGKTLMNILRKSDLMNIEIVHNGEKIRFNLFEELSINEGKINQEIKEQPSYQGFLGVLLSHLERRYSDEKQSLKNIYSKYYEHFKSQKDEASGRALSNDRVDNLVTSKKKYMLQLKRVNKLKFEIGLVETCVSSFNSRKDLIQSLSANVRKHN